MRSQILPRKLNLQTGVNWGLLALAFRFDGRLEQRIQCWIERRFVDERSAEILDRTPKQRCGASSSWRELIAARAHPGAVGEVTEKSQRTRLGNALRGSPSGPA